MKVTFKARDGHGADDVFTVVTDADEATVEAETADFATVYGGTDVKMVVEMDGFEVGVFDMREVAS